MGTINWRMKNITFGKLLESRRTRLGLTRYQLAGQLGVGASYLSKLENDGSRPSLALLKRVIEVLSLPSEQAFSSAYPETMAIVKSQRRHARLSAWHRFTSAKRLLARYEVTPRELKVLASVQSLGSVTAPRDFLFILNSIRQAIEAEESTWA
jgi:transcriptional regulator with XRE-family HTH domain